MRSGARACLLSSVMKTVLLLGTKVDGFALRPSVAWDSLSSGFHCLLRIRLGCLLRSRGLRSRESEAERESCVACRAVTNEAIVPNPGFSWLLPAWNWQASLWAWAEMKLHSSWRSACEDSELRRRQLRGLRALFCWRSSGVFGRLSRERWHWTASRQTRSWPSGMNTKKEKWDIGVHMFGRNWNVRVQTAREWAWQEVT